MTAKRKKPRVIFEELPEVIEKLKACAGSKGLSVSDVIRMAVRSFLEKNKDDQE